jgi:hypothetical protein
MRRFSVEASHGSLVAVMDHRIEMAYLLYMLPLRFDGTQTGAPSSSPPPQQQQQQQQQQQKGSISLRLHTSLGMHFFVFR